MVGHHAHADPPRALVDRLRQLNDNLQALGERLKHSIASVIGTLFWTFGDLIAKAFGAASGCA